MSKNECGKLRKPDMPYEVWMKNTAQGMWKWKVLKKYQSEENEKKNEYARWFCFVTSPFAPVGEFGDVYIKDIINHAIKIK